MKSTRMTLVLLSLLLICAMALNFAACGRGTITCYPSDSTKDDHLPDELDEIAEIQAINLMQGFEAGDVSMTELDDAFIEAGMDFALSLFRGSVAQSEKENLLISPLSVMLALAMTANGADGETLSEMEELLGGALSIDALNEYLYSYVNALTSTEEAVLHIANSIWFRDDENAIAVNPDFLQTNADYYGAAAYQAPFDEQTVRDINNWVKQNTVGMIDRIVDEIDPSTVMYLINAMAFDAEWASPYFGAFEAPFTAYGGEERTVEMMSSTEQRYLEDGLATGFVKTYAGGKYAFAALLPNESIDLYEYIEGLTADRLAETLAGVRAESVRARLPKFSYEYGLGMNELLSEMGMPSAFDDSTADFSKLGQSAYGNLYISKVLQKTFIEVDERGTKAAAVTSVENAPGSAMPTEPLHTVTLDRPFVYFILDTETNLPIFMGTVTDIAQ